MDDFEKEIKLEFLSEATYLLEEAESVFLELEKDGTNPSLIDVIFRLAHNLKGTSKAVGFDQISDLTHVAENLILKIKNKELVPTSETISVLLKFNDQVTAMIDGLKEDIDATFDFQILLDDINEQINGGGSSSDEEAIASEVEVTPEAEPEPEPEPVPEISTPDVQFTDISDFQEMLDQQNAERNAQAKAEEEAKKEAAQPVETPVAPVAPVAEKKAEKKSEKKTEDDEDIRVKLGRINLVNNYIGELVILQTVLDQKRLTDIKDPLANHSIGQMSKIFKELQEIAMSLRMLPLKTTIHKLRRIVRDTSKELTKEINLSVIGEETEVDKKVTEYISDPLVHIVRNAIDHGVETPEERRAAGKDPEGALEIMAFYEGSNVVIQVTDDGKGIDPEIIRKKAIDKGVLSPNSTMDDKEVIQLIFHPGFSTKEVVSDVSGRGVGMDVVKSNIEKLGGRVKVMSKVGLGSSFRIELPLTMAIIEGLIIQANQTKFAIQLNQVQEIVSITPEEITHVSKGGQYVTIRGDVLPFFDLTSYLGGKPQEDKTFTTLILKDGNKRYALRIEEVISKQQVVIKQLGKELAGRVGYVGGTILGDGQAAFILDLIEMFKDVYKVKETCVERRSA